MKKLFILILLLGSPAFALDGVYLGGQVGHVGLGGNAGTLFDNAIGFGVDLGLRTNPLVDVMIPIQHSSHNNLSLTSVGIAAEAQLGRFTDFGFHADFGPAFHFFSAGGASNTYFGLLLGAGADLWLDDTIRIGMNFRWNGVFSGDDLAGGDYWNIMLRFGYLFET